MTARRVAAVLALVLAVACGSGDETPPASSDTLTDVSGGSRSLDELIETLTDDDCALVEVDPTEGFEIHRQAACGDGELQVYTFTSRSARDAVVDGILGLEGEFAVVGENWVAEVRSRTFADEVKSKAGGTIRASTG